MKKIFVVLVAVVFCLNLTGPVYAADQKAAAKAPTAVAAKGQAARQPMRQMAGMVMGTVTSINASDPKGATLEVQNEMDKTKHTITVMPWTNITKVTDISEIKPGDTVRVFTRKTDDKEVAMGIVFGKIKTGPMAGPMMPGIGMPPSGMPPSGMPTRPQAARQAAATKATQGSANQ